MPESLPTHLGPYEILSRLGAGGMGEVYCARDPRLGRKVAIKVLLPTYASNPERLARFEQETRSLGQLNHPNILQVHDTGMHEGSPYLVMELLEGETLRHRLSGRPLPARKAADIAQQIARGLAAAHEKGITHRDLKPENVFITAGEHVKVLDFGLAKLRTAPGGDSEETRTVGDSPALTETGVVMGTAGYLSPEQVVGRPADPRSDIFALGTLLWEMLTGERPFRGESSVEVLHAILKSELPPMPRELALPAGLERILYRCLEKDPRARFQTAQDLAFNLESLSLQSASHSVKLPQASRPRRWGWMGAALAAVALAVGGYRMGMQQRAAHRPLTLQRLTYRQGQITSARFGPDGRTFVFALSRNGGPAELWTGRSDAVSSRPLDLPPGTDVLSVSATGEMAILLHRSPGEAGTLARVPMGGGAPRELLEHVWGADWSPDGKELAVIREGENGRRRLEYPIGHLLLEAPEGCPLDMPRVAPDGSRVAYILTVSGKASLGLADLQGHRLTLVENGCGSLAWAPDGSELLYTSRLTEDRREVRAVSPAGRQRSVYSPLGLLTIHDISPSGRVLADHTFTRTGILAEAPGTREEREASWLQSSAVADISQDGRTILFGEMQEGTGPGGAYLRRLDSRDAVRLGDGDPLYLSPDGKWAVVRTLDARPDLMLLPTGPGESRRLPSHGMRPEWAIFLRDGRQLLVGGVDDQKVFRCYFQRIDTGELEPLQASVGPDGYAAASPDGAWIALGPTEGRVLLHSLKKAPSRTLDGFKDGEWILQWGADSRSLFVGDLRRLPVKIERVDLATGRRTPWKELAPAGLLGVTGISYVAIAPKGDAYAYSYLQTLTSDLYVMDGWR
jgi:serine/threonine protein kinase/WD40 repeat protein